MKATAQPLPIASVRVVPPALFRGLLAFGAIVLLTALVLALIVPKAAMVLGIVGIMSCANALVGLHGGRHARLSAPALFRYLPPPQPFPIGRIVVIWAVLVLAPWPVVGWESTLKTIVMSSGMLGGALLATGWIRRHLHHKATAIFALYADGVLDPADAAAIDDARGKDRQFDVAVNEYQRLAALVQRAVQ